MSARDKRIYGLEAADAGDVGGFEGDVLGPCPSCEADLIITHVQHPHTGRVERALAHSVPFCTYYRVTDPVVIERAVTRPRKEN